MKWLTAKYEGPEQSDSAEAELGELKTSLARAIAMMEKIKQSYGGDDTKNDFRGGIVGGINNALHCLAEEGLANESNLFKD